MPVQQRMSEEPQAADTKTEADADLDVEYGGIATAIATAPSMSPSDELPAMDPTTNLSPYSEVEEPRKDAMLFPLFDIQDGSSSRNNSYYVSTSGYQMSPFREDQANQSINKVDGDSQEIELEFGDALSPIVKARESVASDGVMEVSIGDPTMDESQVNDVLLSSDRSALNHSHASAFDPATPSSQPIQVEASETYATPSPSKREASAEDEFQSSSHFQSAKKEIDESSNVFIETIRSAAHRRKVAMTKSRDSLVAKEREQLRSIAEGKAKAALDQATMSMQSIRLSEGRNEGTTSITQPWQFRARAVPASSGASGAGGLKGVPKVGKRPTTQPLSPLLGKRRPSQAKVCSSKTRTGAQTTDTTTSKKKNVALTKSLPFRARPVPSSVGALGYGGQSGVPKVAKRPSTMPFSPQLGAKRRSSSASRVMDMQKARVMKTPVSRLRLSSSTSSIAGMNTPSPNVASSPSLFGLRLLDTPSVAPINDENRTPLNNVSTGKPFVPSSTIRARKRAAFDQRRNELMRTRDTEGAAQQERDIRRLRKELEAMGRKLET